MPMVICFSVKPIIFTLHLLDQKIFNLPKEWQEGDVENLNHRS